MPPVKRNASCTYDVSSWAMVTDITKFCLNRPFRMALQSEEETQKVRRMRYLSYSGNCGACERTACSIWRSAADSKGKNYFDKFTILRK
jgi:hypothetical protein